MMRKDLRIDKYVRLRADILLEHLKDQRPKVAEASNFRTDTEEEPKLVLKGYASIWSPPPRVSISDV
jgi:hypothetical protein